MNQTDQIIIQQLTSADPREENRAIGSMYRMYFPLIRKMVCENSGTLKDSEELFNDALLSFKDAVRKEGFSLTSKLITFFYAIAKNLWLRELRKRHRWANHQSLDDSLIDHQHDLLSRLITADRVRTIRQHLERLDPACRDILMLFYYNRWSLEAIAQEMNYASAQVAKNKKCRCLNKLRNGLNDQNLSELR